MKIIKEGDIKLSYPWWTRVTWRCGTCRCQFETKPSVGGGDTGLLFQVYRDGYVVEDTFDRIRDRVAMYNAERRAFAELDTDVADVEAA